jgi:hypothetical protein
VRSLASRFEQAAQSVGQRAASFAQQAHLGPDAFGALPAGRQAHADYAERLQEMRLSLDRLHVTLGAFATNLETVAANWVQADSDSTPGG